MKSLEDIENEAIGDIKLKDDSVEIISKNVYRKTDYKKCILTEIREMVYKWNGNEKKIRNTIMINIISGKIVVDKTIFSGIELLDRTFKFCHWFRVQLFFFNSIPYRLYLIIMIIIFYLI